MVNNSMSVRQSADSDARADEGPGGCTPQQRVTRSLVAYGIVAGPFYVAVSLIQATVRDGFDLTRHEWSLLANGPGGWVQSANLVVTGLMVIAAALGFRRVFRSGAGRRWTPRLLTAFGLGMVGAGIFRADPMGGFPVGTPDGPPVAPTLSGLLHLVFAGIGFLCLVAATMVLARRFRSEGRRGWATVTIMTGIVFLAGFAAIASVAPTPAVNLTFTAAIVVAWAWLSITSAHLYRTSTHSAKE